MPTPTPPSLSELLTHTRWVEELARGLVRDRSEADDLAQSALLVALRRESAPPSNLRAWLGRVTRNLARERGRREAQREAIERRGARAERLPSADEMVVRAESERRLVEHVLALEEPHRSTLLLRYFEGMTPAEIALHENKSIATVTSRITRAHARLREHLEARDDGRDWLASVAPILLPASRKAAIAARIVTMSSIVKVGAAVVVVALIAWYLTRGSSETQPPVELAQQPKAHEQVAAAEPALANERASAATKPTESEAPPAAANPEPKALAPRDPFVKDGVGARVFGTVYRPDGQPAPNRRVRVLHLEGIESWTATDATGRYEAKQLKPGFYAISSWPAKEELEAINIPVEGTGDGLKFLAQASFEIADGGERQVDLGVPPKNPIHARGRMLVKGAPVSGFVQWLPAGDDSVMRQKLAPVSKDTGYDVVLDAPGTYLCVLAAPGNGVRTEECVEVKAAPELEHDFVIAERGVRGRVHTADGKPVVGATLELTPRAGVRKPSHITYFASAQRTKEDGSFSIDGVDAGRYVLASWGGTASDLLAGATITADVVVANDGYNELDVVAPAGESVDIALSSDSNGKGVQFFLFDRDGEPLNPLSGARAGKDGKAQLPALSPGKYSVVAVSMLTWSAPREFTVVAGIPTEAIRLRLEPAVRLTVEAPGAREAWIDVRDESGRRFSPLIDLVVTNPMVGRDWRPDVLELRLPPGNYTMAAIGRAGVEARGKISVMAGDRKSVKLER